MTKSQWLKLTTGNKVSKIIPDLDHSSGKAVMVDKLYTGEVKRFNSNGSQVLVKWDTGSEVWYGRTGLELLNTPPVNP